MYCTMLSVSFLLILSGYGIYAGHIHHKAIKDQIGLIVKNTEWIPLSWKADIDGSMVLSVLQSYKLPLKSKFNGNGDFVPVKIKPRNCLDVKNSNRKASDGVYIIYPDGKYPKEAYCDMTTDGGGWTVFQRRFNGSVNFNRNWYEYKTGFGDAKGEYWLGNEAVHVISVEGPCILRIDMVTTKNDIGYEKFFNFTLGSEKEGYTINFADNRIGTAGGYALAYHKGMKFSTKDRDNDPYIGNCATSNAAWWYKKCYSSNLNAPYGSSGLYWNKWEKTNAVETLKKTKMMVRC